MRNHFIPILIFIPFLMPNVGCMIEQTNNPVSVTGTVVYENKPVANALVSFSPVDAESGLRSASAITDADGRFTMMTLYPNDGVMPGEYKVTIRKMEETQENEVKFHLPRKYAEVGKSCLSITVAPKENRVVCFTLSD